MKANRYWMKEFGKRLKGIMDEKGVTVYDLSKKTGIPAQSIYRYIKGESIPSAYGLRKISYNLEYDSDDFIGF